MDAPTLSLSPPEWGAVLRLCLLETRRILGPGARADDAAQEATIRAWRYWDRRSHSDAVGPWVRTIARHEAYRIAGRSQRETLTSELDSSAVEDPNAAYVDAVARTNVVLGVETIRRRSPLLDGLVKKGTIKIVGAMYDLASGAVEMVG